MDRKNRILQRLMSRIQISTCLSYHGTPCWIWTGSTSGKPKAGDRNSRGHSYPRITINGTTCAAHHVMYTHFFGYIPAKMTVDHECKNRLCMNPHHLSLVSHWENTRRRDGKKPNARTEYAIPAPQHLVEEALVLLEAA